MIADAVEWIRTHCKFKPRIFVATTPGFLEHAKEGKFVHRLVDNLKHGYGMGNYVWVREFTKMGFPHWHFVADIDQFDPVKLSLSWSKYFGSDSKASIRVGSKKDKEGKRSYWIKSQRKCWYLTKYLGKSVGAKEEKKKFRTFAISQEARRESEPLVFEANVHHTYSNTLRRTFTLEADNPNFGVEGVPHTFDPHSYGWKWTGYGQTYSGFPKKNPRIQQTNTENAENAV